MHFLHARNAIMHKYNYNRKLATLAIRIAKKIDDYEILSACIGFDGKPLLSFAEYNMILELISGSPSLSD